MGFSYTLYLHETTNSLQIKTINILKNFHKIIFFFRLQAVKVNIDLGIKHKENIFVLNHYNYFKFIFNGLK